MGTKVWVGLAIFICMWTTNLAVAADWSLVPSITQKSEFDSNLNGSSANKLSDFIFTISPSAVFAYTTENAKLQGSLGVNQQLYVKYTGYNHTDQNYQINGQYRMTPRFNLSLNTGFISDSTAQEEFLTSGLIITRIPRLSFTVGPGVTYNLTERLSASLNYNFIKVDYQPQTTAFQNFQNYYTHSVGSTWQYLWSERTTLFSTFSGTLSNYTGSTSSNYKSLLFYLGLNHNYTENLKFNLAAGFNYSFYSTNSQVTNYSQFPFFVLTRTQTQKGSNASPYFNLGVTYQWTRNLNLFANFNRNQSASAYGYIAQVNALGLGLHYNFTEKLSGSVAGGYTFSNQSFDRGQNQSNSLYINPQLSYRITERLTALVAYRFYNLHYGSSGQSSTSSHIHDVWLMFTYSYPMHYQR
jgi:hypothetical protein